MRISRLHGSIGLLVPILACSTSGAAQTFRVHTAPVGVEMPFHSVFYAAEPAYEDLPLATLPLGGTLVAALPKIAGTFGMAELRCAGVDRDRHLKGCVVTVAPTGRGYEAAAGLIAKQLMVDPTYPLSGKPPTRFISIQLKMWHSDVPVVSGPCWPPSCASIMPPPPRPG
ncbi:hypothetical protein BH10PSE14_BH10PSE14_36890 [soil metagenome]